MTQSDVDQVVCSFKQWLIDQGYELRRQGERGDKLVGDAWQYIREDFVRDMRDVCDDAEVAP
jgi:hypothetical protein